MIPTSLTVPSISYENGNLLQYVITLCSIAQTASYAICEF